MQFVRRMRGSAVVDGDTVGKIEGMVERHKVSEDDIAANRS